MGISPTNGSSKVGGGIRLRPLKFLDNAGEAEITKTDFAVRVNQYVRLVTRAMSQLQDNTTRPCKVAMNNGTLVQV